MGARISVAQAAEEILRRAGHPLHHAEITRRIMSKYQLRGKTPGHTVCARLSTDKRFKRVSEGVYALADWKEYPTARFAKDIAYDFLKLSRRPVSLEALGSAILEERHFGGTTRAVAKTAILPDPRFYYNKESGEVGLTEWKKKQN